MRHSLSRVDIFCTLRRAYARVDDMHSAAFADAASDAAAGEDLLAEEGFVVGLEAALDMHAVRFAKGFWRMFAAFLESVAFRRSIDELAAGHAGMTYSTQEARLRFFESFTQACEALERMPVPRSSPNPIRAVGRWVQRRRGRLPPQSVDSFEVVCGSHGDRGVVMAHIRWRNQSGHMLVYEIMSAEDGALV